MFLLQDKTDFSLVAVLRTPCSVAAAVLRTPQSSWNLGIRMPSLFFFFVRTLQPSSSSSSLPPTWTVHLSVPALPLPLPPPSQHHFQALSSSPSDSTTRTSRPLWHWCGLLARPSRRLSLTTGYIYIRTAAHCNPHVLTVFARFDALMPLVRRFLRLRSCVGQAAQAPSKQPL